MESNEYYYGINYNDSNNIDEILKNKESSRRFGEAIAINLFIGNKINEKIINIAENNKDFSYGLGISVAKILFSLNDNLYNYIIKYSKKNQEFAHGLGYSLGKIIAFLSDDLIKKAIEIGNNNKCLSRTMGNAISDSINSIENNKKELLLKFSISNKNFSEGLEQK